MVMITSNQNPKIQKVRSLFQQSKERKNSSQFVIEGVRLCEEALQAEYEIEYILFSENLSIRGQNILEKASIKNIPVDEIPLQLMKKVSGTENPQGIICVLNQKTQMIPTQPNFILICDSISDPGNLGTIFRSADAAKVQAVIVAPNCADIYSPKVVRSGMGAHFHIPIIQLDWSSIMQICKNPHAPLQTFIASADAKNSLWEVNLTQPLAILIGSESTGPGVEAHQLADQQLRIPMPGSSESLNAAIAASIIIFETVRQRWK
jgi:TrmH family RNA methyltransferase